MKSLPIVILALFAGCASNDPATRTADKPAKPVSASRDWASPGYHIAGTTPAGWARHDSEQAIVALSTDGGVIELSVAAVDVTFPRPDEEILEKILEGHWKKISTSRFDLLGASAARGDFTSSDASAVSTHVIWEWHEGAKPGRKFMFHVSLRCAPGDHARLLPGLEAFLAALRQDRDGPDTVVPDLAFSSNWSAKSLPLERALIIGGCRIPAADDPFVRRDIPISGWLDARDRIRAKRLSGEKLTVEESWEEALAHYNLAIHMLWAQVGAPVERHEGSKMTAQSWLQVFGRMNAAVALNAGLVAKLQAERDGRPWADAARLRWNASVLESLAVYMKTGELDGDARATLHDAAAAPVGDYKDLALAWWKELDSEITAKAVGQMAEVRKLFAEKKFEEAEEAAREVLATTGGQWPDADRAIAAAAFETGRLGNAAGAAHTALAVLPGAPNLILENAEILLAAGRIDEAQALLDDNRGLIRDSLRDNSLVFDTLQALAYHGKGDDAGASASIESLLKEWADSGSLPVGWDFNALRKASGEAEPMRSRLAAVAALLDGRGTPEEVRKSWATGK
ncbi:MAG: tetratricopeptide repeat protein [Planctomycetes bacterium]|nr:tetratricopeptide repeat protein [Planctomycetota bacterium]